MKDGAEGDVIASRLERVEVGTDIDGDPISSCVIIPADATAVTQANPKLTKNQQTMFAVLQGAGARGLTTDEWNERARDAGIGLAAGPIFSTCAAPSKARGSSENTGTDGR
jgi:hypothetical protein